MAYMVSDASPTRTPWKRMPPPASLLASSGVALSWLNRID
jgi:hypothetical protein